MPIQKESIKPSNLSTSFISLSSSDSGLTIVRPGPLVRRVQEQNGKLKNQNETIINLKEYISDLKDVVHKCT